MLDVSKEYVSFHGNICVDNNVQEIQLLGCWCTVALYNAGLMQCGSNNKMLIN